MDSQLEVLFFGQHYMREFDILAVSQ